MWDADGKSLPPGPGNVGEVVTRGLHVMKRHLNKPEDTASVFTGKWFDFSPSDDHRVTRAGRPCVR